MMSAKKYVAEVPLDVKVQWLSVIRRLQSVGRSDGLSIVSISVLVDPDGIPKFWTEPKCVKIEPRRSTAELIELLTELNGDK